MGCVGVGAEGVELDVVEEVPKAYEEEPRARCYMANQSAHSFSTGPSLSEVSFWVTGGISSLVLGQ